MQTTFGKKFQNLGSMPRRLHMLFDLEKAYDRLHREKLWGVLRECGVDGRPVMFDGRILVKLTQFCVRLVALWSQNGSFQTPQGCRFSIGLCFDA